MRLSGSGVVLNNFLHDLATGVWFGVFIVMWRMAKLVHEPRFSGIAAPVKIVQGDLFSWGLVALGVVLVSGAVRTAYYRLTPIPREMRAVKLRLLIAKHVVLVLAFGAGTVLEYLWWTRI